MTRTVNETIIDAVEAAMPDGVSVQPRHITDVPYARSTIRHALRELVARGRVVAAGPDSGRRYTRVAT